MGDKLTKEEKAALVQENQRKYGLSREYLRFLRLPRPSPVQVLSLDDVLNNTRRALTAMEKIEHLITIKATCLRKLEVLESG